MNWLWLMTDSLVKYQFYWEQRERVKYYEPKFNEKVFTYVDVEINIDELCIFMEKINQNICKDWHILNSEL